MKLEIIRGLIPEIIRADRVLITADNGTPIAVATAYGDDAVFFAHAGEASFQRTLAALGIDRTVITTMMPAPALSDFKF